MAAMIDEAAGGGGVRGDMRVRPTLRRAADRVLAEVAMARRAARCGSRRRCAGGRDCCWEMVERTVRRVWADVVQLRHHGLTDPPPGNKV
jgi:hypothetical protein